MNDQDKLIVFNGKNIRRTFHNDEWIEKRMRGIKELRPFQTFNTTGGK
jgi:hypothetical protein